MKTPDQLIDDLIALAFAEDIGDGDHTTLCCIPADEMGRSKLLVKEEGILAGVDVARRVFTAFDPSLEMEVFIEDGAHVKPGDVAFVVSGRVQSLLQTERIMLNIMQRMSGIATVTHEYMARLEGLHTRVLDTRKTTPGMRILEKEAVRIGGRCKSPYRAFRYDSAQRQPCRFRRRHRSRYYPLPQIPRRERKESENRDRST